MKRFSALLLAGLLAAAALPAYSAETTATGTAEAAAEEHPATVPTLRTNRKERFLELHQSHLKRAKEGPIGVLFLGDSITERWTSAPQVWNRHFARWNPANFGVGGDRTQHVLWRIENGALDGISPKVLVLLIGTNNANSDPPEPIVAGITKIVQQIRKKLPDTKVLVMGILPRAPRRDKATKKLNYKPIRTIAKVNPEIARLDDGKMVRYIDIGDRFLVKGKVPKELMPDGVHLSEKGYEVWAEAITPVLEEMMRN